MSVTPRRTLRVPDGDWNAGQSKAQGEGKTITDVLRRLLSGYLAGHRIEYRATSKIEINGQPVIVAGLSGNLSDLKKLFPRAQWTLDEYDVSPPRTIR